MKTYAFGWLVVVVCLELSWPAAAGPSLPVTKPPVQTNTLLTGPAGDPPALLGQWFMDKGGTETFRPHEFHDNVVMFGGGLAGENAIFGYVDSIDFLGGVPGIITNFTILATINNDLVEGDATYLGDNSHGETRMHIGSYVGPLLNTKLAAEFAVMDGTFLPPQPFVPPYRETTPLIEAVNEDQGAWYCWNPTFPEHTPPGAYYVPTWDFGDIALGNLASRQLVFAVPAGLPSTDSRYTAIVASYTTSNDILQNRTASLKISTWIDDLALDTGGSEEPPLRHSDVSVFHYIETEEQDLDFGDAPDPKYPTLLINDGARHVIDPAVFMGLLIDSELDGQPDATATGDDKANLDDEDGVAILAPLIAGQSVTATVNCSTSGLLFAWVDFNANGSWGDFGETQHSGTVMTQGVNFITINVPAAATTTTTFARFRFTTLPVALSYTGLVANGEVEDYKVEIFEEEEEPTMDFGDATDSLVVPGYPTLLANNGARHVVVPVTYLGFTIDREPDGQPDGTATGDDNNPPAGIDDEDGVLLPTAFVAGSTAQVLVVASAPGFLNAWIDWNGNSTWLDPFDQVFFNQPLIPGPNLLTVPVPVPPALVAGGPHTRWRFTSYPQATPLLFNGLEMDGEVEDYEVRLQVLDFGDAPDPTYQTLLANDGARHLIPSAYYLGLTAPDLDPDGWPSAGADGDDLDTTDDEDGVFVGAGQSLVQGDPTAVLGIIASASGYLNAWLDFDQDGTWVGANEWVANDVLVPAGVSPLVFSIPATAQLGPTIGRFRFASTTGLGTTGLATDGEVEDHVFTIYQNGPTNPAGFLITNIVVDMSNNTYTILWDGETNVTYQTQFLTNLLDTVTPWMVWGANVSAPPWRQADTNAAETSKFYRLVAPYSPPPP